MIRSFYIQNHCSVKNRINISFEASSLSDTTSFENVFRYREENILKIISFYGANASGKSSIIKGLAAMRELIVPFVPGRLPYCPFSFSQDSIDKPTFFGIEFSLDNTETLFYRYEVSFDKNSILKEKLEKFSSQKPTLLFDRTESKIVFGSTIQNNPLLLQLSDSLIKNKTFLSIFANIKIQDFYDAYLFFFERLINISPEVTRFDDLLPAEFKSNEQLKNFSENLLKAADFDIDGIEIKKKPIQYFPAPGFSQTIEREMLVFNHKGQNCGGQIEFVNESLGTKKILIIAKHLYDALTKSSILIVDELESSLHPDLARLIIEIFLDDSINIHNSQLIFTSHNAALLDLGLFRREQINFVYKDKDTCSTFIRSLKDFHVRKTDSIDKSYLAGRFSTSPNVNKGLFNGEE